MGLPFCFVGDEKCVGVRYVAENLNPNDPSSIYYLPPDAPEDLQRIAQEELRKAQERQRLEEQARQAQLRAPAPVSLPEGTTVEFIPGVSDPNKGANLAVQDVYQIGSKLVLKEDWEKMSQVQQAALAEAGGADLTPRYVVPTDFRIGKEDLGYLQKYHPEVYAAVQEDPRAAYERYGNVIAKAQSDVAFARETGGIPGMISLSNVLKLPKGSKIVDYNLGTGQVSYFAPEQVAKLYGAPGLAGLAQGLEVGWPVAPKANGRTWSKAESPSYGWWSNVVSFFTGTEKPGEGVVFTSGGTPVKAASIPGFFLGKSRKQLEQELYTEEYLADIRKGGIASVSEVMRYPETRTALPRYVSMWGPVPMVGTGAALAYRWPVMSPGERKYGLYGLIPEAMMLGMGAAVAAFAPKAVPVKPQTYFGGLAETKAVGGTGVPSTPFEVVRPRAGVPSWLDVLRGRAASSKGGTLVPGESLLEGRLYGGAPTYSMDTTGFVRPGTAFSRAFYRPFGKVSGVYGESGAPPIDVYGPAPTLARPSAPFSDVYAPGLGIGRSAMGVEYGPSGGGGFFRGGGGGFGGGGGGVAVAAETQSLVAAPAVSSVVGLAKAFGGVGTTVVGSVALAELAGLLGAPSYLTVEVPGASRKGVMPQVVPATAPIVIGEPWWITRRVPEYLPVEEPLPSEWRVPVLWPGALPVGKVVTLPRGGDYPYPEPLPLPFPMPQPLPLPLPSPVPPVVGTEVEEPPGGGTESTPVPLWSWLNAGLFRPGGHWGRAGMPRGPLGYWQTAGYEVYGPNPLTGEVVGGVVGRRRIKYGAVAPKFVRSRVA